MLVGWKHACQCTKCKAIKFVDKGSNEKSLDSALAMEETEKSDCCHAPYEYIGLRPEKEHILITPELDEPEIKVEIEENQKDLGTLGSVETFKPVPKPVVEEKPDDEESETMTTTSDVKLEDIIDVHRKMSGRYMTDVVRSVLEEDNDQTADKLAILKSEYPSFFQDALKYVPKFLKSKYNLV